jgi:GNAT superfamily N-acetyltransferase
MIRYEIAPLHTFADRLDELWAIGSAVNEKIDKEAYPHEHLVEGSRRGDIATVAFDGDKIIGFCLMTKAEHILSMGSTIPLKLWLYNNGYDFGRVACSMMIYVHPDYWEQGLTKSLLAARDGCGFYAWTIHFRPATPQIIEFLEAQPRTVNTGLLDERGFPILIRDIRGETSE